MSNLKIRRIEFHIPRITYKHPIFLGYGKRNPVVAALKAEQKRRKRG